MRLIILLLGIFVMEAWAYGQEATMTNASTLEVKPIKGGNESLFLFSLVAARHTLKAGDGNELQGNGAIVSIGRGYIAHQLYVLYQIDLFEGPHEPARSGQMIVNFGGTGFSTYVGYSAQNKYIRDQNGGYGFALGVSYVDMVGRAMGANRHQTGENRLDYANKDLLYDYQMRVNQFSLIPTLFFSWFEPPRLDGNTKELLMTRTEGYIVTFGIATPYFANYKVAYRKLDVETSEKNYRQKRNTEHGELEGVSVLFGFTSLFGG